MVPSDDRTPAAVVEVGTMNRRHEYAVRWRREGAHEQVRVYQTAFYARRYLGWLLELSGDTLDYARVERRSVGPWETIDVVVGR